MRTTDAHALLQTVQSLWKRRGRFAADPVWDTEEVSVFIEQASRVNISLEAATAAVRNLKGTSDKFPTVASVIKAVRQHELRDDHGISPVDEPMDQIAKWRRQHGIGQVSASEVFAFVANRAVFTAMELYGHVYPALADELMRDCDAYSGWTVPVKDDFAAWLLSLPSEPPVGVTNAQAQRLAHLRHRARCREVGKEPQLPTYVPRKANVRVGTFDGGQLSNQVA